MDLPAHQLSMTVLMTPDTANFAGNVLITPGKKRRHEAARVRRQLRQVFARRTPATPGSAPS